MSLTIAWHGFVLWAATSATIRAQFQLTTGVTLPERSAEFDSSDRSLLDFAMWVTLAHWGEEGVPEEFMREARERFPNPAKEKTT